MKQLFKRSTAWLLCLAMLFGLFASVPGAIINKVSAADDGSTEARQSITTDHDNYFGNGHTTYAYASLSEAGSDFEDVTIADLQNLGWTLKDSSWSNFTTSYSEEWGSDVLNYKHDKINYLFAPLIDVSELDSLTIAVDAKLNPYTSGGTDRDLLVYCYFFDANGVDNNDGVADWMFNNTVTSLLTAGAWCTAQVTNAVPSGAVYAMPMIAVKGDCQLDNLSIFPSESSSVLNKTFSSTTTSRLGLEGWTGKEGGLPYFTVINLNGNMVWEKKTGTANAKSPLIDVSGKTKVTFYSEIQSSIEAGCFLYFYEADGKTTVSVPGNGWQKLTSGDDAWQAKTYTIDISNYSNVKYVQYMTNGGNKGYVYYDNIAINHVHEFSKASNLIAAEATCTTPAAYYGECECGAISHVATVEVGNNLGHTDANPKDHKCDICSEATGDAHEAAVGSHDCAYCGKPVTTCVDTTPKDHKCDVCGETTGDAHEAAVGSHDCAYCGKPVTSCVDTTPKDHNCDICGEATGDAHEAAEGSNNCAYCGKPVTTTAPAATTAPVSTTVPTGTNPDTGDNAGISGMLTVMILAATSFVALVAGRKFNFSFRK